MRVKFVVTANDAKRIRSFVDLYVADAFVQERVRRNVEATPTVPDRTRFWHALASCLLTTQQRSGPDSAVAKLIRSQPFPLSYRRCVRERDVASFSFELLTGHGGIRRTNKLSSELAANLPLVQRREWSRTKSHLIKVAIERTVDAERAAARHLSDTFMGLGPKQSRNALQVLGLSLFEIPLDSRIAKWLNEFGFPIHLNAVGLSDEDYYCFVLDGVQALCQRAGVYPCVLDAAIFASYDAGRWTKDNVIW